MIIKRNKSYKHVCRRSLITLLLISFPKGGGEYNSCVILFFVFLIPALSINHFSVPPSRSTTTFVFESGNYMGRVNDQIILIYFLGVSLINFTFFWTSVDLWFSCLTMAPRSNFRFCSYMINSG